MTSNYGLSNWYFCKKLSLQTVDFKNSNLKRLKSHLSKSIMIFWNVILVSYFYFVWNGTEINVTFHLCRLRQSTQRNIVNINGSSSEWINVWTHFVLEYFITQYLKGLQHNIPVSGLSLYMTMTILISLSSPSWGIISREKFYNLKDGKSSFSVHRYLSIIPMADLENI